MKIAVIGTGGVAGAAGGCASSPGAHLIISAATILITAATTKRYAPIPKPHVTVIALSTWKV